MEGFIADSTFNIISATLDEKSFDTKTLTPRYHLPPPPSTDTDKKKSMRVERYETNDGVNPAENDCIEIGAASLHYLPRILGRSGPFYFIFLQNCSLGDIRGKW